MEQHSEEDQEMDWVETFLKVEKKYSEGVVHEMVKKEFDRRLTLIRAWRNRVYDENDKLRAVGVSFSERKKLLNQDRLKFCDEQESKLLKAFLVFKVKPLYQWFGVDDYWVAKRSGMEFIIRLKFDQIYFIPNSN